ncbi:cell envelope integrity protein CreD [Flavobacterium subsaxonicum]
MEINQNQNPEQEQPEFQYPAPPPPPGFMQSSTAKIIMVGLLTLVLLIPLQYVKSLILERAERQENVVNEINQKWGESVYLYGPVIKVPYITYTENKLIDEKTNKVTYQRSTVTDYAYFFPNDLTITANVPTEHKKRNNYESVVYTAAMDFKGNYTTPDFSSRNIPAENIKWESASIVVKTNNIRSIKGAVGITLGGKQYTFEPAENPDDKDTVAALETRAINLRDAFAGGAVNFDFKIQYKGSEALRIVPIGKNTQAKMTSNWASPSFEGNFIPDDKTVSTTGFDAQWKISHLNRPFAQQHFGALPNLSDYSFDVKFLIPVNQYQQNERASKYGFLIIGLTFLIFFLIQSVSKISIHIFQYTMIGLALIMFYTLLISITEHSSFRLAYIIAGLSVVAMIGLYSISILKNFKFPAFIATALSGLYAFIYVIIQLENYALLVGSIGLFLILGAVMYFSRKIDWGNANA